MLNQKQIQCCTRITCGKDQGTGFFITKQCLMTASHAVWDHEQNGAPIYCNIGNRRLLCKVISVSHDLDICLLSVDEANSNWLPLLSTQTRIAEKCQIIGFPYKGQSDLLLLSGQITQILLNERSDFKVLTTDVDGNFDYEGLSGAPVVNSGKVIGITLRQVDNSITAVSIFKIASFLRNENIQVDDEYLYHDIPTEFRKIIGSTSPNYKAFHDIDRALESPSNWLVIQGSPGSGKTTISASYNPKDDNIEIFGRYFLKVPGDTQALGIRVSPQFFLETVENLVHSLITGLPISKEEIKFEARLKRLCELFQLLNEYYKKKSKIGLFIVDGIDEASDIASFLTPLFVGLGNNLKVAISCTSTTNLPIKITSVVSDKNIIIVKPLELIQCEYLIHNELQDLPISIGSIQDLAAKSEGHPLYLHYLINYVKAEYSVDLQSLGDWIKSVPTIGGDIRIYYESIWQSIYQDLGKLWPLIILAQLRQPVDLKTLHSLLPLDAKISFSSSFPSITFLLTNDTLIQVYHNSFKEYINQKASINNDFANDLIAKYCVDNLNSDISVSNIIFHLSRSSKPLVAAQWCDQTWADRCALNDVAPDLVISDIRLCISVVLSRPDNTSNLIRLLLLLQRITFRYDSVFKENATLVALTLTSEHKYISAIKYLVRDNTLLVSNGDALFFLQQFTENGAEDQVLELMSAIDRKFSKQFEQASQSDEGIDLSLFTLRLNALAIRATNSRQYARQWVLLQNQYRNFQQHLVDNKEDEEADKIKRVREKASAYQIAYSIRKSNEYTSIITRIPEEQQQSPHPGIATILATAIAVYDGLKSYNGQINDERSSFSMLIEDLETLIQQGSYQKDSNALYLIAKALVSHSRNSGLITDIVNQYITMPFEFNFRKENGVDLDLQSIETLLFRSTCEGFVETQDKYPPLHFPKRNNWEAALTSVIKCVGFVRGKYRQAEIEKLTPTLANQQLNEIANVLLISLDSRSKWKRSYLIPETLIPRLNRELFSVIFTHNPGSLESIISQFTAIASDQFGLYSEGFRRSLFEIISACVFNKTPKSIYKKLLFFWENHIKKIENRWERTPEFLKLIEIYNLIQDTDNAVNAFSEMLNTSMGPTWYKEAQMSLVNECMTIKTVGSVTTKHLQRFAAILDCASGEMTFQQYVRYNKESFISTIANNRGLEQAIEYFKFEVAPPPSILIHNAESKTIDVPRPGDGYQLGAANISEPAAVRKIIKSSPSPYIRWFLSQAYLINSDTERFLEYFAQIQAVCINELLGDQEFLKKAGIAINQNIEHDDIKDRHVFEYIRPFFKALTKPAQIWFREQMKLSIDWDRFSDESVEAVNNYKSAFDPIISLYQSGDFNRSDLLHDFKQAFVDDKISIWHRNWSTKSSEARSIIKLLFRSSDEITGFLRPFIEEYSEDCWSVADELIWFGKDIFSEEEKNDILDAVVEHFNYIIRPDEDTIKKYSWLNQQPTEIINDDDELVIDFVVWLLNHPAAEMPRKARDVLYSVFHFQSDLVVASLIREIKNNSPNVSTEACAEIFLSLTQSDPAKVIKYLESNIGSITTLSQVNHFTVKKMLYDSANILKSNGFTALVNALEETIPTDAQAADVYFQEEYLDPIQYFIDELNSIGVFNRSVCESLLQLIQEFCSPVGYADFRKSDRYLLRSFYSEGKNERYPAMLKHALNIAISSRVEKTKFDYVYNLLKQDD